MCVLGIANPFFCLLRFLFIRTMEYFQSSNEASKVCFVHVLSCCSFHWHSYRRLKLFVTRSSICKPRLLSCIWRKTWTRAFSHLFRTVLSTSGFPPGEVPGAVITQRAPQTHSTLKWHISTETSDSSSCKTQHIWLRSDFSLLEAKELRLM